MFKLKPYQEASLEALKNYLDQARLIGAKQAFDTYVEEQGWSVRPYIALEDLETVPYVCLRLPTGGGKTLLSAHSIQVAAHAYLERDYPLVLWMVPSNTIRLQTLETLKNPDHPNRQALDAAFDGRVLPMDISDFAQLRPQDIRDKAVVVVSTLATARVNNPELRHFYAHNENLEPHFSGVPRDAKGLEKIEEGAEKGRIKFSFRNLLAMHRPLVLLDEAHNASSKLSVEVLQRIHPACIVEYTATPAPNSNVLFHVSAAELKTEEMIKLPIILTEHQSWEAAIDASIDNRTKLSVVAEKDKGYIRPIVLIQAENKNKDVSVDVVHKYLLEDHNIAPERIAIATGDQRELDGIDLFDPKCPIEYVITVQALKEGWDCSFAYVFCSVATVHSKRNVEQLLGRVLRMPYAQRRVQDELNQAYAHVASASWPQAVSLLHDRLVDMGFESQEAAAFIKPEVQELPLGDTPVPGGPAVPFEFTLSSEVDVTDLDLDLEEQTRVQVTTTESGTSKLQVTGLINNQLQKKLEKVVPRKDKKAFDKTIGIHIQHYQREPTPAQKGECFAVPQLCLWIDGELELLEKELLLYPEGWNLLDFSPSLTEDEFSIRESGRVTKIDVRDRAGQTQVYETALDMDALDLNSARSEWTEGELSRWLDKHLRQPDIKQPVLLEYLRQAVVYLTDQRGLSMSALVRARFALQKVLLNKIRIYRQEAYQSGFQETLFGEDAKVETSFEFDFRFDPRNYPAHSFYQGSFEFRKHYHTLVGDLKSSGEELDCAQAIDRQREVKHWIRNLERQPDYSFWLPTSTDRFYPDFVTELTDGRLLVVEYKGAHLVDSADTREKENVGKLWEEKSEGRGLFLLAVAKDDAGRDVFQQLEDKIAN